MINDSTGDGAYYAAADTDRFPATTPGSATVKPGEARPAGPVDPDNSDDHATRSSSTSRGGWCAITLTAAALLIVGILLTMFGPVRYWTPVQAVFLGYFLISGAISLVFWKGVRELRDSNPTLRTHQPGPLGARAAAAVGAVGVATALILLPAGLATAPPANALPCPDGTNTCGPQPPTQTPIEPPTQGGQVPTTAIQAPNTTVPPYADTPTPQTPGPGQGFQGTVQAMPTADNPNGCIVNCPTPQAPAQIESGGSGGSVNGPQAGQAPSPGGTGGSGGQGNQGAGPGGQQQDAPVVTTTPAAPAAAPSQQQQPPAPQTTRSAANTTDQPGTAGGGDRNSTDSNDRDRDDKDDKSRIPPAAAELAALAGTYRRRKADPLNPDGSAATNDMNPGERIDGDNYSQWTTPDGDRTFILSENQDAPSQYRFTLNQPDGGSSRVNPDGSVSVLDRNGNQINRFDTPWAYDTVTGQKIATRYTLDNGDLVQTIDRPAGNNNPILADPNPDGTPTFDETMATLQGSTLPPTGPYTPEQEAQRAAAAQVANTNQTQAPLLDAVGEATQPAMPDPAGQVLNEAGSGPAQQAQVDSAIASPVTHALQPEMPDPTTNVLNAVGSGQAGIPFPEGATPNSAGIVPDGLVQQGVNQGEKIAANFGTGQAINRIGTGFANFGVDAMFDPGYQRFGLPFLTWGARAARFASPLAAPAGIAVAVANGSPAGKAISIGAIGAAGTALAIAALPITAPLVVTAGVGIAAGAAATAVGTLAWNALPVGGQQAINGAATAVGHGIASAAKGIGSFLFGG